MYEMHACAVSNACSLHSNLKFTIYSYIAVANSYIYVALATCFPTFCCYMHVIDPYSLFKFIIFKTLV